MNRSQLLNRVNAVIRSHQTSPLCQLFFGESLEDAQAQRDAYRSRFAANRPQPARELSLLIAWGEVSQPSPAEPPQSPAGSPAEEVPAPGGADFPGGKR